MAERMRMSKKLKYLLALHEITFLIIGLACFLVDFHIWRETGSFPPSGVGSPAFPIAYFGVLCCLLPMSLLVKRTAKAESRKKIEAAMKCKIIIFVTWLLLAAIACLTHIV